MKTVWIIDHHAMPLELGFMVRQYQFGRHLARRGYDVTVFASSAIHNTGVNVISDSRPMLVEIYDNVPFAFVRTRDYSGNGKDRIIGMFEYALRLFVVTKKSHFQKPEVIYASSPHPLAWLVGYMIARRYKAKFVAETRDLWPETFVAMGRMRRSSVPARLLYRLERFIYEKADKLVFTMPGGIDYAKRLGIDTSKVAYINNGVDIAEFEQSKENYIFRDADLENPDTFKVVYAGSMGQANALQYVLEAAEITQSRGIDKIKFLLFGDGYQLGELRDYAESKGLTNIVFKGRIEKKYIPSILSKADLNVFTGGHIPSIHKYGLSLNKMFEYFASGKPTISNIECSYDILEKYDCGMTVRGGSAEALADGILDFYYMPTDSYDHFCRNALFAAKEFDFCVLVDKLEQVLLE